MNKKFIKVVALVIAIICMLSTSVSASSVYKSYVYNTSGTASIAPEALSYDGYIDVSKIKDASGNSLKLNLNSEGVSLSDTPGNMYIAKDGKVYIADTGNKRIIILNEDFTFNKVITSFNNQVKDAAGAVVPVSDVFSTPTYVFVDEVRDGDIYICDVNGANEGNVDASVSQYYTDLFNKTEGKLSIDTAGRVIVLDKNGNFKKQIVGIHSEILPDDFVFQPLKMTVDNAGRLFILSRQCIQGIIELSEAGEFVQCLGAAKATYSAAELIKRMFMSEAQREEAENFVSSEYSGITVDEDNFIYVTNKTFSETTVSQLERVAKLNAKGKNVLRAPKDANPYGDDVTLWKGTYKGPSTLVDIITLDDGVYATLDSLRSRVFFYNSDGINLFEFGTKPDSQDPAHVSYLNGTMTNPVSLAFRNETCYVLDASTGYINKFVLTDYAKLILKANNYHTNDEWDKEEEIWQQVLKLNHNSAAAKQSIAKVYYRQGDYDTAMAYFKDILDQDNYSLAYKYKRQIVIEEYFLIALIVLIVFIVAVIIIKKLWKKFIPPANPNSYIGHLKYAGKILGRPLNASWFLVRENHASVASATTILLTASVVSLLQARFTGFIFNATAEYVNIILELLKIILPVMLFCVCNWCVTSLLNGEGNFRAIYIGTCYSLTPIIIFYPFAILLSNVMVLEEGDFFSIFIMLGLVLTFLLIYATNMRIHDYGAGFALLELFITLVVIVLVVFLAILFFALCQQMFDFVSRLLEEISTRA